MIEKITPVDVKVDLQALVEAAGALLRAGLTRDEVVEIVGIAEDAASLRERLESLSSAISERSRPPVLDGQLTPSEAPLPRGIRDRQISILVLMPPGEVIGWSDLSERWGSLVGGDPAAVAERVRAQLKIMARQGLVERAGRGKWRRLLPYHRIDVDFEERAFEGLL